MGADDARRPENATTTAAMAAAAAAVVDADGQDLVESGENKGRGCDCAGGGGGGGGGAPCSGGNVYTIITTGVSGIKCCLSVANAVANLGFKFNTLRRAVFGGSAVVEVIGFLFAVNTAHERWAYDSDVSSSSEGMRGSGSPIMIMWESPAASFEAEWLRKRNDAVMLGLGAQALALWYCMTVHWYIWGLSGGVFTVAVAVAWSATLVIFHAYQHQRRAAKQGGEHRSCLVGAASEGRNSSSSSSSSRSSSSSTWCQSWVECLARVPAVLVALLPPIVVNIAESVLIFTGTFSPAAYLLAVLDLVLVIPVVYYVLVSFSRLVCHFQKVSV